MIGQTLDHYRILDRLGAGGMATVYLAEDTRHQRRVAVKVLAPELAQNVGAERFLREIETTGRLVHPHIVPLHDSGSSQGVLYYVMPYVTGETLRMRLARDGRLPVNEALQFGCEIADALVYAHAQGLVHRDLKPENVLLSEGHAVVADFGIAQALSARGAPPASLTQAGFIIGTPAYMSPEQSAGCGPIDGRSDLYSLGCVLHEMLAGTPPARRERPADIRALRPEVPPAVAAAVSRLLAAAPEGRFASASELRDALGATRARKPAPGRGVERAAVPHNLQKKTRSFVGRGRELAECRTLLADNRLLTLTGVGGCGKTRLATELAEEVMAEYPSGVWFVDLAALTDPARVVPALASTLGVREEPQRGLLDTIVDRLEDGPVLLLVDNCEHLLLACADLAVTLLPRCGGVKLLATSREGLNVPGEQVYTVPSLSLPRPGEVHDASTAAQYESIRLFVERAKSAWPHFVLDGNAAAIADICRRLDGIPLAIELAAAWVRMLSIEQIRDKLDDRFRFLTGGGHAALPRQQTLRATLQWSYDLLTPEDQRLFAAHSVFAGGWTLDSSTAVCGAGDDYATIELLYHLVGKSLVVTEWQDQRESRYRFLDTVRQYAREELGEGGEARQLRDRHFAWFMAQAEEAGSRLEGAEQVRWLAVLEAEHENLLAALAWSAEVEDGDRKALALAGSIWRYWNIAGEYALGRRVLGEILARPGAQERTVERARALYGVAGLAVYQGDFVAAEAQFRESLAIAGALGDGPCEARALNGLGFLSLEREDFAASAESFERSLAVHRAHGNRRGMAVALSNLGLLHSRQGDYAAARRCQEESLESFRHVGDLYTLAMTLATHSVFSTRAADLAAARTALLESLRLVFDRSRLHPAADRFEPTRGLPVAAKRPAAHALEAAAELATALGEKGRAVRFVAAARALREAIGMPLERRARQDQDRLLAEVRSSLGDIPFAQAWSQGQAAHFQPALHEAETWLDATAVTETEGPSS